MSGDDQLIVFTICGQEFRLRQVGDKAGRMKKVAASLEQLIRERKGRVAVGGELRTAIMTAFELAYELAELKEELSRMKSSGVTETMDRLLERIEKEMGAVEDANPSPSPAKEKTATKKKNG